MTAIVVTDEKGYGNSGGITGYWYPVVRMECTACGAVEKAYADGTARAVAVQEFARQHDAGFGCKEGV
jgi:hypothetical protein